ncbi:type II secretion system protein [bacterium]|nr:type II secretion system protein [bacterium]MBR4567781.1 type II secretion system protein [bacterium]
MKKRAFTLVEILIVLVIF